MIVDACERTLIGFASTMAEIASYIALKSSSAFTNCVLHLPWTHPAPMTMHHFVDPLVAQSRKNGSQRMKVAVTMRFLYTTKSVHRLPNQNDTRTNAIRINLTTSVCRSLSGVITISEATKLAIKLKRPRTTANALVFWLFCDSAFHWARSFGVLCPVEHVDLLIR